MVSTWPYNVSTMPEDDEEKNVRVRIPASLHAAVTAKARAERRSLNAQILACLEECTGTRPPSARTAGGADIVPEKRAGYDAEAGKP